ncbi:MAG: cohesin domain-containing protein [Gemmatimonadaceae bacterium]
MTKLASCRISRAIALLAGAAASAACSESYRSSVVENPAPAVEAVLVISDAAPPVGAALVVSVQAKSNQGTVGSYTARIKYDSAALRFEGEIAMSDNGLRALNPSPGLLRFAGATAGGFPDGRLASYKFVVLQANAAKTLSLAVDEMHMITRTDAKSVLTVAPNRAASQ